MANVAQNDITIFSKNKQALEAFRDQVADLDPSQPLPFSIERIRPTPPQLTGVDLIKWRDENWGTKWDAIFDRPEYGVTWSEPNELTPHHYRLEYRFETAWCSPWRLFDGLKASHPELTFWWDTYSTDSNFHIVWRSDKGCAVLPPPLGENWDGSTGPTAAEIEEHTASLKSECENELEARA